MIHGAAGIPIAARRPLGFETARVRRQGRLLRHRIRRRHRVRWDRRFCRSGPKSANRRRGVCEVAALPANGWPALLGSAMGSPPTWGGPNPSVGQPVLGGRTAATRRLPPPTPLGRIPALTSRDGGG